MVSKRQMAEFTRALGRRIATLRVNAGLTQQALAEHLDSAISVVSRMENGGALPSITRLVEMADIFGVEVSEFFLFEIPTNVTTDDKAETVAKRLAALLRLMSPDDTELVVRIVEQLARRLRK